jgi:hypothetical protein
MLANPPLNALVNRRRGRMSDATNRNVPRPKWFRFWWPFRLQKKSG